MLQSRVPIRVRRDISGLISTDDIDSSSNDRVLVDSILILAGLHTFIATAVACLRRDGKNTTNGHQQKLDCETFVAYLPKAYEQIVGTIQVFEREWPLQELELPGSDTSRDFHVRCTLKTPAATVRVSVPSV